VTILDDAALVVADAVESATPLASHLHPVGSFDVEHFDVPTGLEEIWRFTPLKRLRGLHTDAPLDGDRFRVEVDAPDGVIGEVVSGDSSDMGSSGYVPYDRISARAYAASSEPFVLRIAAEAVLDRPVLTTLTGTGADVASAGHAVIIAEPHSVATVVLRYTGSAVYAGSVEIVVGEGARLTVVSIQDWAEDAVHHAHHHALVKRDGLLRHVAVSFGGDLVRMNTSVAYDGTGGEAELLGLYFADAGQHLEHRLFVDHNAPHTRSNVDYRGALQGQGAHSVWVGDVLIRKVAEGITTYESNRNLVLNDGCRADSVPNLEIETGQIEGAGHASTTGRFDDEQLFYLRSRGIPETEARRLVVHGFFADIIRRVGVLEIEQRLLDAVEAELAVTVGLPS
jgi:Fe-S cluster assembly protein SufD